MRRPDDALFLDMLVHARRVAAKVSGVTRSDFDENDDLQLALVYLIQVIGEAASRLTAEQRASHPDVPWRDIIGMRHVVVHDYFRIDLDVVWDTANLGIPDLIAALERIVPSPEPQDEP
ncbi:MAG: DUF86 domain-containing protein [Chloroflexi bacterium]|nr:DUF86 domain-containing protein [Chloroflexota bacterium]